MISKVFFCCLLAVVLGAPPLKKEEPIAILSFESEVNADGSFHYSYEGENGNKAEAVGQLKSLGPDQDGVVSQGSFSYIGDDGKNYQTKYVADENGYVAVGDHLPKSPPIPEAIARSLKYIAEHPARQ